MSRKKSSKRRTTSRRGAAGNSCCPVIRVRCDRSKGGKAVAGLGSITFPWEHGGHRKSASESASVFTSHGPTRYERREGIRAKKIMCTVTTGSTRRRVNVVDLKSTVNKIAAAQEKKRCRPLVKRG